MPQTIKTWSFTRLSTYERCPLRAKFAYIDRIPEPERPLPPGKTEHANDRGTRIHDAAERFVKGGIELIPELSAFEPEYKKLRELYSEGRVSLEREWAFNAQWQPTSWDSHEAWVRVKLDAFVRVSKTRGIVIDYKTGRKSGNELKHADQCALYQLSAFLLYPELKEIDAELWYLDQDELSRVHYTREQGMKFFRRFDDRARKMTSATEFAPSANRFNCRWCPYGIEGTGHCEKATSF